MFVETKLSGLGGLWRRVEPTLIQHADFAPGHGRVDHVDGDCRRPAAPGPDASAQADV
jgi:hypothetical protein